MKVQITKAAEKNLWCPELDVQPQPSWWPPTQASWVCCFLGVLHWWPEKVLGHEEGTFPTISGCSPSGSVVKNLPAKQEMWVSSLSQEDLLEKEMATHSSILARKPHGQRSLAGYSPWGHKRGGCNFSNWTTGGWKCEFYKKSHNQYIMSQFFHLQNSNILFPKVENFWKSIKTMQLVLLSIQVHLGPGQFLWQNVRKITN